MKQLLASLVLLPALLPAADVCNPRNFGGTYGFQLSGTTTISGTAKPTASVGRLEFHPDVDSRGNVSGYSSAHFSGFLLGNPVAGTYEAHVDCTLTWSLQDDSGGYQHFSGSMTPDFKHIQFRQTDPGGPERGEMSRTADGCGSSPMPARYRLSISGVYTPMQDGQQAHRISVSGTVELRDGGKLLLTAEGKTTEGRFTVETDCSAQIELAIPTKDSAVTTPMTLRGLLVDDGKQILGIQTDPGATVTAHFTAQN